MYLIADAPHLKSTTGEIVCRGSIRRTRRSNSRGDTRSARGTALRLPRDGYVAALRLGIYYASCVNERQGQSRQRPDRETARLWTRRHWQENTRTTHRRASQQRPSCIPRLLLAQPDGSCVPQAQRYARLVPVRQNPQQQTTRLHAMMKVSDLRSCFTDIEFIELLKFS
jgi:hypothetical protein